MGLYYPSCVVHIGFAFDPTYHVSTKDIRDAAAKTAADMVANRVFGPPPPGEVPLALETSEDSKLSWFVNLVPRSGSVEVPGYRQAAKFQFTFSYHDIPINPILIKAAQVRVHIGCVTAEDFATGMDRDADLASARRVPGGGKRRGTRRSYLETLNAAGEDRKDTLVLVGVVDRWKVKFGQKETEVTIEGRDLRAIFLESPVDSKTMTKLDLTKDIVNVVQQILEKHPLAAQMKIKVQPADWDGGGLASQEGVIPSPGTKDGVTRVRLDAKGQKPGSQPPVQNSKLKFWDIIIQYCQPKDALVCRGDLSWTPIGTIRPGDTVLGFAQEQNTELGRRFRKFEPATVEAIRVRNAPVVALHMASGRVVRCTADHRWFTGRSEPGYEFMAPKVGRPLIRIHDAPAQAFEPTPDYRLGYMRGLIEGDAAVVDKQYAHGRVKHITLAMRDTGALARYTDYATQLGLTPRPGTGSCTAFGKKLPDIQHVRMCTQQAFDLLVYGDEPQSPSYMQGWLAGMFDAEGTTSILAICQDRNVNPYTYAKLVERLRFFGFQTVQDKDRIRILGGLREVLRFFQLAQPASVHKFQKRVFGTRMSGEEDRVLRIEPCGEEEVVSLQTSTGTYMGQGYASSNCYLVGAIPFFQGHDLLIRPVRSLYDQQGVAVDPTRQTPFAFGAVRKMPNERRGFAIRRMVYGHNIEELDFERKFVGHMRPRVIQVVCMDTGSGKRGEQKLLTAEYPEDLAKEAKKSHATKQSPGGQLAENEVYRVPIHGVKDTEQLKQIARAIFESIGRYEIEGHCSTKDLASLIGPSDLDPNEDPDMTRLRPGDAVEFSVDSSYLSSKRGLEGGVSELTTHEARSFEEEVQAIAARINDLNIARAIVATTRNALVETQSTYRVHDVSFKWSDKGLGVDFSFHNFIEATYGQTTKTEPKKHKPKSTTVRAPAGSTQTKTPSTEANSSGGGILKDLKIPPLASDFLKPK